MTFNIALAITTTMTDGGYTYWDGLDPEPTVGYCVDNNSTSLVIDVDFPASSSFFVLQPQDYVTINQWAEKYGAGADGVSCWLDTDTNKLYLQATTHFPSQQLPSALQRAVDLGETSIYSIATGDSIEVTSYAMTLALIAWSAIYVPAAEGAVMKTLVKAFLPDLYN